MVEVEAMESKYLVFLVLPKEEDIRYAVEEEVKKVEINS